MLQDPSWYHCTSWPKGLGNGSWSLNTAANSHHWLPPLGLQVAAAPHPVLAAASLHCAGAETASAMGQGWVTMALYVQSGLLAQNGGMGQHGLCGGLNLAGFQVSTKPHYDYTLQQDIVLLNIVLKIDLILRFMGTFDGISEGRIFVILLLGLPHLFINWFS